MADFFAKFYLRNGMPSLLSKLLTAGPKMTRPAIARINAMIQKRITILDSSQPICSK